MEYESVVVGKKNKRRLIVDQGTFAPEKEVTSNLNRGQIKIILLNTKDCPIKHHCIDIEHNISSICDHLGPYPSFWNGEKYTFDQLPCDHGDHTILYKVGLLKAENCADGKQNCIGCENLKFIQTRPDPLKSHCYILCSQ